jgi:hypothetical protein
MAFKKLSVACSAFLKRRMCVMRMLAFTAKTKPAGVASTQAASVVAAGRSRKV